MRTPVLPFLLLFALAVRLAAPAAETPLPALDAPEAWRAGGAPAPQIAGAAFDGVKWLRVTVKAGSADRPRLLLREPLPLPAGHEVVWRGVARDIRPLFVFALVRDARGKEYRVFQESRSFCRGSMFLNGYFDGGMHRHGEVLFRTKGFRGFPGESYAPAGPGAQGAPQSPLTLLGLEFTGEAAEAAGNVFHFRDFRLTAVAPATSRLYYQFNEQECFGELSGDPALTLGDALDMEGPNAAAAQVDWSVRADYAGQPFLAGGLRADLAKGPRELALARRIAFPVRRPGTYWARVKCRALSPEGKVYKTEEKDFRLYVIRGEDGPLPAPLAPGARLGQSAIRFAPERASFLWGADEKWELPVAFHDAAGAECAVRVRDAAGKELAALSLTAPADAGSAWTTRLDLSALPAGIYRARATIARDGALVDAAEQDVARRPAPDAAPYARPAGVPTAQDLLTAEKPLAFFDAHLDHADGYVEKVKRAMDAVRPITPCFEIRANWHDIERLPGAYDFSAIDALLDHAAKNGSRVQPLISFHAPEWAPSHYTQNPQGEIFGHNVYLFHGARLNLYQSPVLRPAALKFVEALVRHCRRHPALMSYYFLIEHPGEAPYKGWHEGFDPFTLANFRAAMRAKHGDVAKANAAWKTHFPDFAAVMPPLPGAEAANAFWLDWMRFRDDGVESFRDAYVDAVRRLDPERMVMSYGDGTPNMAGKGVFTANGGCARPEVAALAMATVADRGTPQRAEEITVTQWTDYPWRLDDSLFTMMHGGGVNAHCKMFFPVDVFERAKSLDALRRPPHGLDRFEKFLPLWAELHPERLENGGEVRYFFDADADLLTRKTTFFGGHDPWNAMLFLDAQVPFGVAPGRDWEKAKLVVVHDSLNRALGDQTREALARYVENGGNLLFFAAAGRYSIERGASDGGLLLGHAAQDLEKEKRLNAPENDWLLLRRLGFNPPEAACRQGWAGRVAPAPGAALDPGAPVPGMGVARGLWVTAKDNGELLATARNGNDEFPIVARRAVGKGHAYVIWAQALVPHDDATAADAPLLAAVARACGAALPAACSDRRFWALVLKHPARERRHLLVMRSHRGPDDKTPATVRLPRLPDGDYAVTELIGGGAPRTLTGAALREKGLTPKLARQEVAIWRVDKIK